MKLINQRTLEKLITGALVVSILVGFNTPVFAQTIEEVSVATSETTPQFPIIEKRVIPKATRYVSVTAYSSDVYQNDSTPFLPANGVDYRDVFAKLGQVPAVALNDLPLGTVIRITDERLLSVFGTETEKKNGEMIRINVDRKNARYNGKWSMDMYVAVAVDGRIDSKESLDAARKIAKQFGVKRQVKIEILEYGTRQTRTRYTYAPASETSVVLAATK